MVRTESQPPVAPLGDLDKGQEIRIALAAYFNGRATGRQLRAAVSFGGKRSTFYDALKVEREAGHVRAVGGRYPVYELIPMASESRSPEDAPDSDSPEPNQGKTSSNPNQHKAFRDDGPDSNAPPAVQFRGTREVRKPLKCDGPISVANNTEERP